LNVFACAALSSFAVAFAGQPPPPPAGMETVIQDDAQLLYRSPAQVRANMRKIARAGANRVRLTASWRTLAPDPDSPRRPRFDATDSRAYSRQGMARLDRAILEARRAHLAVMVDLGFFAPRWAVTRMGAHGRNVWRPSPVEFGRFARAIAARYDGAFRDRAGRRLPAVRLWTTWNEPNHRVFLQPQWERANGRWRPASPHIYRALHEAGYSEVKRASRRNRVLIGGLASFGNPGRGPTRGIAPLRFTRELACVDSRLRPLSRPECRGFKALRADGFALHPYSLRTAPPAADPRRDRVQIGELGKLTTLLDRLHRGGRIASDLPLYLTEYGYETRPQDPNGVPARTGAHYLSQATFLAASNPRVRMFPQFLLDDIGSLGDGPARSANYQTGLYDSRGLPKRAVLQAFRTPFYATAVRDAAGRPRVAAFGQVRPGNGVKRIEIERLDPRRGWVGEASGTIAAPTAACPDFAIDGRGFYLRALPYRGRATYRAVWLRGDGRREASPTSAVTPPRERGRGPGTP
jgi:hypothetical protein